MPIASATPVASLRRAVRSSIGLLPIGLWSLGLMCFGCGSADGDDVLVDSVGVRVTFDGTSITPVEASTPITCDGDVATETDWRFGGSRVVALCPSSGMPRAIDCRPVVCGDESDCPSTTFFDIACDDRVCVRVGEPLRDEDVVLTCVAELPRLARCEDALAYSTDALVLVGDALERHCGGADTCSGPIVCGLAP